MNSRSLLPAPEVSMSMLGRSGTEILGMSGTDSCGAERLTEGAEREGEESAPPAAFGALLVRAS
jgi:hypothetical protein